MDWYTNFSDFPNLDGFFGVTSVFESYRLLQTVLFFDRFCFSMCCLLILMNLWVVSGGMNHGGVGIQYILHQYK